jgi:transposase
LRIGTTLEFISGACYDGSMPSLVKKSISGRKYYYLVWHGRVNGKPRHIRQVYLGSVEEVTARLAAQVEPQAAPPGSYSVHREFGASTALWAFAQELGLAKLIDAHVPRWHGDLSVGQYLTLVAINRCIAPASKRAMGEWYSGSYVSALLPVAKKALQGQRFWDAMNEVTEEAIAHVEEQLIVRVQKLFGLNLRRVLYDATNFFTFIDTGTQSELAQRGHNKAKRDDLRQVSLALLVAHDFGVPLFHHCYAGNITDSNEFSATLDPMLRQLGKLTSIEEVTIVFDKGNNSEANFKRLADGEPPLHFVGSLPPSQHKDLQKLVLSDFVELKGRRLKGVKACRTTKKIFGHERTVVVTWNPRLAKGQDRALLTYLEKKAKGLRGIQERLTRLRGRSAAQVRTTVDTVQREVRDLLKRTEVKQCIRYEIGQHDGLPTLEFAVDEQAVQKRRKGLHGRNVIFTSRENWTTEDIVLAYRGQYQLEHQFRNMKNPHALCWSPRFHWTDQKIRVHAFYCVLGLLLLSLLQRKLAQNGIDMTIPGMLSQLRGIQETTTIVSGSAAPEDTTVMTTLSQLNPLQQRLYDALDLGKFRGNEILGTTTRKRRKPPHNRD